MLDNSLIGKKFLVIHGKNDADEFLSYKDSSSNAHWLPWIQREIVRRGGAVSNFGNA